MEFVFPGRDELDDGVAGDDGARWAWPLAFAERACCCPARPVVVAVMPPSSRRPYPIDLLLCGHHYRASLAVLLAAGAAVYDEDGAVIPSADDRPVPAGTGMQHR